MKNNSLTARENRRELRASAYRALWRWHFWSGLLIGPVVLIVSLTGALYVFKPELERLFLTELMSVTPGPQRASFEDLRAALATTLPRHELHFINVAADPSQAWEAFLERELASGEHERLLAYYDPYARRLLGTRATDEGFFPVVLDLHRRLMAGLPGRLLVEFASCWAILSVLSGLYLWWPRRKERVYGVWLPRVRANLRRLLRDWHTVPGMYLSLATLAILVSGLLFTQIWGIAYRAANAVTGGFPDFYLSPPTSATDRPLPDRPPVDIDAAFAVASRTFDFEGRSFSIEIPHPDTRDAYQIVSDTRDAFTAKGVAFVDQYSGELLLHAGDADLPARTRFTLLFYPIHVGSIFGLPTKILAVVCCLGLIALTITGYWLWWRRRTPGTWGVPRKLHEDCTPNWLIGVTILLSVLFPTVGLSFLLLGAGEWAAARMKGRKAHRLG